MTWPFGLVTRLRRAYHLKYSPVVTIGGVKLELGGHISPQIQASMIRGSYEAPELRILASELRDDDVVLELGTGLGLLSTYCAQRLPAGRVFTFEANPALEAHIRRAYTLNAVAPTLEICLLGPKAGEASFHVEPAFWSSSTVKRSAAATEIKVPMRPFNEALQRIKPSLVIVDIEGGEYDLTEYADFGSAQRIIMEVHPHVIGADKVAAVRGRIEGAGFRLVTSPKKDVWLFRRGASA